MTETPVLESAAEEAPPPLTVPQRLAAASKALSMPAMDITDRLHALTAALHQLIVIVTEMHLPSVPTMPSVPTLPPMRIMPPLPMPKQDSGFPPYNP
jgi:hypothetical protein